MKNATGCEMKKKLVAILLIIAMSALLAGCGNMSLGLGNFTFKKVHVDTHNYSGCFTIEKWYDNASGIEVKTKEFGSMYLAEGMYMLIEEDCPFCGLDENNERLAPHPGL